MTDSEGVGTAQASDVGHYNGDATTAGTRYQPLTCINSWNVWHHSPPEIFRRTGNGVERKEERGGEKRGDGMRGGSQAIGDHCAKMAPSRN